MRHFGVEPCAGEAFCRRGLCSFYRELAVSSQLSSTARKEWDLVGNDLPRVSVWPPAGQTCRDSSRSQYKPITFCGPDARNAQEETLPKKSSREVEDAAR